MQMTCSWGKDHGQITQVLLQVKRWQSWSTTYLGPIVLTLFSNYVVRSSSLHSNETPASTLGNKLCWILSNLVCRYIYTRNISSAKIVKLSWVIIRSYSWEQLLQQQQQQQQQTAVVSGYKFGKLQKWQTKHYYKWSPNYIYTKYFASQLLKVGKLMSIQKLISLDIPENWAFPQ